MSIETWFSLIDYHINNVNESIFLDIEFEGILEDICNHLDSPVSNINTEIIRKSPFDKINFGSNGEESPQFSKTIESLDQNNTKCVLKVWSKTGDVAYDIQAKLENLIKSFWKPTMHDEKSRLLFFQNANDYKFINHSINRLLKNNEYVYVLYLDLDNFKKVNDTFSHEKGNEVIQHFSSILDRTIRRKGIAIHLSGDEFSIVCGSKNIEEILILSKEINKEVSEYNFDTPAIRISTTIGISVITKNNNLDFKELIKFAEKATKDENGKKRGLVRFFESASNEIEMNALSAELKLSTCILKSSIYISNPYSSVWLNFISNEIQKLNLKDSSIQQQIDDLIQWCKLDFDNSMRKSSFPFGNKIDLHPTCHFIDVAFAICHGIYRDTYLQSDDSSKLELELKVDIDFKNKSFEILNKENVFYKFGSSDTFKDSVALGGSFVKEGEIITPTQRAILIKIGHSHLDLSKILFSEIITIDDRPTRGGGLPDFWEATIARLITNINNNPNVDQVYVLGKHEYGLQTIDKLKKVHEWKNDLENISLKTGISQSDILIASNFLTGKILFPENEKRLLDILSELLKSTYKFKDKQSFKNSALLAENRFLKLEANLDSMCLKKEDGLRVNTIYEAFPIILEIARRSTQEPIIDQAGQELKELIDFKVCLLNPTDKKIPYFYEKEKVQLEGYFQKQFINDDGLFGSIFIKTGQLDAVINHVVNSIKDEKKQFATRRAILVIPHEIKVGEDITPLGLISIRIIPRFEKTGIKISYSYTWRTVEALVGFPYSIYGSVCYSEYLTKEIKERVNSNLSSKIQMAEVYYTANSLHIFMDHFGQNIARNIIFDASN